MIDIAHQIDAISRGVARRSTPEGGEGIAAVISRRYEAAVDDVWEAITDPERIARWMMPVTGELKEGGHFQLEGNAGGTILRCERPSRLRLSFGHETSIVELRLTPDGDATVLELEHTVPDELTQGAGAAGTLYVGPGWDGAFLALGLYLQGEVADDPVAAASSPEAQAFSKRSARAWYEAALASGLADQEALDQALAVAEAQYAPEVTE
jgi:uncharacterized protein YndB with AHSA1/START domain